jgi:hypothetical protein
MKGRWSMPKSEMTAIEVAVRNAGLRSGWTAMSWALDWGMLDAKGELSGSLSARTAAVGKWWGYSEAKAWRRHCAFRKAFPMFETPSDLIAVPANQPLRDFLDAFAKMSKVVDAAKLGKGMAFMTGAAIS